MIAFLILFAVLSFIFCFLFVTILLQDFCLSFLMYHSVNAYTMLDILKYGREIFFV
jgi:hypothetical protein